MPLYEYRCQRCDEVFEVIQRFSDTPLAVHEKCGGDVERLVSAPALQFKGTGWYVTDYGKSGSNGRKEAAEKSKSEGKGDSKSSEGKGDSKSSESKASETKAESAKPSSSSSSTSSDK
jgi:putative FmdB family regulatory protein